MKKNEIENLSSVFTTTLYAQHSHIYHCSKLARNTPHSQVYFYILNIYIYWKTSKQDLPSSFSDIGFKTSYILNSFSILKKSHQQTVFPLLKRKFKTTIENNAKHAFFRAFRCWLKLTQSVYQSYNTLEESPWAPFNE